MRELTIWIDRQLYPLERGIDTVNSDISNRLGDLHVPFGWHSTVVVAPVQCLAGEHAERLATACCDRRVDARARQALRSLADCLSRLQHVLVKACGVEVGCFHNKEGALPQCLR